MVCNASYVYLITVSVGDTDSVFVCLSSDTLTRSKPEIWALGEVIADWITATTFAHEPEVILEMEKYYLGFMLITKKKYVGWVFKSPNQDQGSHGGKGTLAVRRDALPFQKSVYNDMRAIMFEHDYTSDEIRERVLQRFHASIDLLCSNQADPKDLIQKKKLNRPPEKYPIPPPHVAVALKIKRRHANGDNVYGVAEYKTGDYVPFIFTFSTVKTARKGDLAEDPLYWSNNRDKIMLNIPFYLDNLNIVSELVSAFTDPSYVEGMLEAAKLEFVRKYNRTQSIAEHFGANIGKRKLLHQTARGISSSVKRKKNPLGTSCKSMCQQSLRSFFSARK